MPNFYKFLQQDCELKINLSISFSIVIVNSIKSPWTKQAYIETINRNGSFPASRSWEIFHPPPFCLNNEGSMKELSFGQSTGRMK